MNTPDAWIARDRDGFLCIFFYLRPILEGDVWVPQQDRVDALAILDMTDYPDVTFENSPVKVTITKP